MARENRFVYFVEGDTEKRLIEVLKTDLQVIKPGKVRKLNVIEQVITQRDLMQYPDKSVLVFLFDTDTSKADILTKNLSFSKKMANIGKVICIPQVRNMEEELEFSCVNIRDVTEITQSRSRSDFKRDFLRERNLVAKLAESGFDMERLWSRQPCGVFRNVNNASDLIRK